MKIPEVRQFENLDALIACVGDPQEFAKQLKQLRDAEKALNERYKIAASLQEGESFLADAAAKLNEARDVRKRADEILADAKQQAEATTEQARADAAHIRREAEQAQEQAQAKLQEAHGARTEAQSLAQQGRRDLESAQALKAQAEQQMEEARAIRSEFEAKVAKLKVLAG